MIRIQAVEEYRLRPTQQMQVGQLLRQSFADYPKDRIYYKQIPTFRLLAFEKRTLVGHLAVEFRLINIGGAITRIFGVTDVCVAESFQSQKLATTLLDELSTLGQSQDIDFIILFADQHDLYLNNGFELVNNVCRWLIINNHQSLGLSHRRLENCLLVKSLNGAVWGDGVIDFLGHVF